MNKTANRVHFLKQLHEVTNKIHAAANVDTIILDLSRDICDLFDADRLTIYLVAEEGKAIVSKVKTGLNAFRDLRLPINDQSLAGYVALNRVPLNIGDVYDDAELARYSPRARFLKEVDARTGYRTRQMLVAPLVDHNGALQGVIQLINHRAGTAFPFVAMEGVIELASTLAIALRQRKAAHVGLASKYDQLVVDGALSGERLDAARQTARDSGVDLESVLLRDCGLSVAVLGTALAHFFRVPYEPFRGERLKPATLLRHFKREYCESNRWLPLEDSPEGLVVLALDPEQVRNSGVVGNIFGGGRAAFRVTTEKEFAATVDQFFGSLAGMASMDDLLANMDDDESGEGGDDVAAAADNELVRLVNKIIVDAYQQGASDIHIEPRPGKEKTVVRLRKDGALVNYIELPAAYRAALVTRLKIMCDLDIAEKRKPQDGKIKFKKFGPLDIELRVATLPTAGGLEDVVMRILAAGEPIRLAQLGLAPANQRNLLACIEKPYGLFFVCGPTGSGKTTTLHSVLGHLNRPETKIWTAEDPVEITQRGLRQVQINKKAGLDFATVMRAFLRADPDIIMVGEMRDAETAGIGIEASLTGHLVLATLHTNSAPESIIRLLDMGMDPFNFADALLGILAQRLARRLCPDCRQAYRPEAEEIGHLLDEYSQELLATPAWRADPAGCRQALLEEWRQRYAADGEFTLQRACGCEKCGNTGYRGRLGLHELLVGSDPVKRLVQERARVAQIVECALGEGMRTLKMDGIDKVLQGLTDLKQVRAVCIR